MKEIEKIEETWIDKDGNEILLGGFIDKSNPRREFETRMDVLKAKGELSIAGYKIKEKVNAIS